MNNLVISTDPRLLGVDIPSLNTSPSVSTMPEEDASICPLLPATPSPPPMDFIHPLTPSPGTDDNGCESQDPDNQAETSSSGSSGIVVNANGASSLFSHTHHNAYQHLGKNGDLLNGELDLTNAKVQNGSLSIPMTKETPSFVGWNWPLIRKCTFFLFMSGLFAMCGIVVAMIIHLPKSCNPDIDWYKGGLFYELFPASFQDSNGDGIGDLKGISRRVDYFEKLGVNAIRLNSVYPSKHYPDEFEDITSLMNVDKSLGTIHDMRSLANNLHLKNISLVLDLPLFPTIKELDHATTEASFIDNNSTEIIDEVTELIRAKRNSENGNTVSNILRFWCSLGVDGFYIKGLENFSSDPYLLENLKEWKYVLGRDRILMINSAIFDEVDNKLASEISSFIDLVDVFVDIKNGSQNIANQLHKVLKSPVLSPGFGPTIHWSIGGVSDERLSKELSPNASLALITSQMMMPGTIGLFYGDEIALRDARDPTNSHKDTKHLHHLVPMVWESGNQFTDRHTLPWLAKKMATDFSQLKTVRNIIQLRKKSPAIYQIAVIKNNQTVVNTSIRYNKDDIFILERWYPRRNTFVSISNFGEKKLSLDLSGMFYSGTAMIGQENQKILFSEFKIDSMETIIVKLDK